MGFVLLIFSVLVPAIIFAFMRENNLKVANMQYFNMEFRVPDKQPLFNETLPLIQCMVRCLSMSSCLSVFVSKGETCRGYHFTHRFLTGQQFRYSEEENYFYKVSECNTLGYTWNSTHQYCYKFHTKMRSYEDARAACSQDDPRSHLFLVDSENAIIFLQYIIDVYGNVLYLQGVRENGSSPFLNIFGGEMTYFMWDKNEPASGSESLYLRTSTSNSTLMEVSTGELNRMFLCFIM